MGIKRKENSLKRNGLIKKLFLQIDILKVLNGKTNLKENLNH